MTVDWRRDRRDEVEAILARYPEKRSAIMPLLHLAQEVRGYVTEDDLAAVGELIGETTAYVESVASFYVMYRRQPKGRFEIVVCDGLSCMLRGSEQLTAQLEDLLGVRAGETTADNLITLETTHECLAACEGGPCLQVNHEYYLNVDRAKAERLVEALRKAGREGVTDLDRCDLPPDPAPAPADAPQHAGGTGAGS